MDEEIDEDEDVEIVGYQFTFGWVALEALIILLCICVGILGIGGSVKLWRLMFPGD